MKKTSTLFKKHNDNLAFTTNILDHNLEWVLNDSKAYIKTDGTPILIKDNKAYFRFDYKIGRELPKGAIPCQEKADKHGHFPHWVLLTEDNKHRDSNRFLWELLKENTYKDGTYEFVGQNINGGHEGSDYRLISHTDGFVEVKDYSYLGLYELLLELGKEGIVFHRNNSSDTAKIRLKDYGIIWNRSPKIGNLKPFIKNDYKLYKTMLSEETPSTSINREIEVLSEDFFTFKKLRNDGLLNFSYEVYENGVEFKDLVLKKKVRLIDFEGNTKKVQNSKLKIVLKLEDMNTLMFFEKIYKNPFLV